MSAVDVVPYLVDVGGLAGFAALVYHRLVRLEEAMERSNHQVIALLTALVGRDGAPPA